MAFKSFLIWILFILFMFRLTDLQYRFYMCFRLLCILLLFFSSKPFSLTPVITFIHQLRHSDRSSACYSDNISPWNSYNSNRHVMTHLNVHKLQSNDWIIYMKNGLWNSVNRFGLNEWVTSCLVQLLNRWRIRTSKYMAFSGEYTSNTHVSLEHPARSTGHIMGANMGVCALLLHPIEICFAIANTDVIE